MSSERMRLSASLLGGLVLSFGAAAQAHFLNGEIWVQLNKADASEDAAANLFGAGGIDPGDHPFLRALLEEVGLYRDEVFAPLADVPRESSFFADPRSELRAGVGDRLITPPRGCPQGGYGDRMKEIPFLWNPILDPLYYAKLFRASRGVGDEIHARAVVLESGGERVCLVGVESIGVTQLIFEDVLRRVEVEGIGRDALIIGGTHTHAGPGDAADHLLWWFGADLFDARIYNGLVDDISMAILDAVADLEPARVGLGASSADFGLSHNRREGQTEVDHEIAVLRVDDSTGAAKAVLFNFAVHGTVLGGDNNLFTGDCMGRAMLELESTLDATAIFLNGTEGDVSPSSQGGGDGWERIQLWGEALAGHVLDIYDGIETYAQVPVAGAHIFVDLPLPHARPGFFLEPPGPGNLVIPIPGMVERNNTNFTGVRVGNAYFLSMPGEATTAIGTAIKEYGDSSGRPSSFVVGLANGHLGYMVSEDEYWAGGYESGATLYGAGTGALMVDSATQVLNLLSPDLGALE